jgi:ankyrin repeat protein
MSSVEFVTAAENAIHNGDLNELQRLLNIDHSVINKKYRGDTAIMKASRQCNGSTVVAFLLKNGANINDKNVRDTIDQTPLIVAADSGCKDIVEMLLQAGANIEHRNDQGETALISAAQEGHKEIVQMLLDAGANVNQENADGETALDLAVRLRQNKDLINLLLEYGAFSEAKGFKIKTKKRKRRNKRKRNTKKSS